VVTDPSFERMFYKLAGFRFLGKRAVRIDILERLADLIRPLLQWKPGTQPRPEGAYDGRRFTTTTAMLSILGATLDDMEEILKGLGYRADQVSAEEAATFLASQGGATGAPQTETSAEQSDDADSADKDETSSEEPVVAEAETGVAAEQGVEAVSQTSDVDVAAAETAEPKPVLLWRPGGRNENQRNDNRRPGNRPQGGERRNEGGEGRRDNRGAAANRDGERKRDGGQRPDRGNRPDRQDRGERKDRPDRNDRGGKPQAQRFEAKPPRKEKPLDPDSPFAKLAALKEQMKK
jgi:ATP-dependent RNA helicase SUPV3L1/SUV3